MESKIKSLTNKNQEYKETIHDLEQKLNKLKLSNKGGSCKKNSILSLFTKSPKLSKFAKEKMKQTEMLENKVLKFMQI